MPDPDRLLTTLRQATQAFRATTGRSGHVIHLTGTSEVLAAGDLTFQYKAIRRMRDLMGHARAIVLVSHDLPTLAKMCDRLLWLDHGQIRQIGHVGQILAAYEKHMHGLLPKTA